MWEELEVVEEQLENSVEYQPQGVIGCNHISCCADIAPY